MAGFPSFIRLKRRTTNNEPNRTTAKERRKECRRRNERRKERTKEGTKERTVAGWLSCHTTNIRHTRADLKTSNFECDEIFQRWDFWDFGRAYPIYGIIFGRKWLILLSIIYYLRNLISYCTLNFAQRLYGIHRRNDRSNMEQSPLQSMQADDDRTSVSIQYLKRQYVYIIKGGIILSSRYCPNGAVSKSKRCNLAIFLPL